MNELELNQGLETEDDNQQIVDQVEEVEDQGSQVEQPDEGTPDDNEESDKPEFSLDEDGNLQWNLDDDESEEDSSAKEQPTNDGAEITEPEDDVFKVKVNGEEVEVTKEELLKGYMRQADYTKKTQSLANERRSLEQSRPSQTRQPQQYQQTSLVANQEPSQNLNDVAKQMAARNLGLDSVEELSELDFDHITAVVEAKNALIQQSNSLQQRKTAMDNLETQLRAEDPAYDVIMANVNDKMADLPYRKFEELRKAYETGNTEPLRAFYQEMAKEYYSKSIQKVAAKKVDPPKVIASNTVPQQQKTKKIDFRKIGSLSADEKAQLLIDMGIV